MLPNGGEGLNILGQTCYMSIHGRVQHGGSDLGLLLRGMTWNSRGHYGWMFETKQQREITQTVLIRLSVSLQT